MLKNISFKMISKRYGDFLKFSFFLLPYWKIKLLTIFLSGLLVPLSLVLPYLTKLIIDKAYANKDLGLFIRLIIVGAGVFIITAVVNGASGYLEGRLRLKVSFDINSRLFQHLTKLSLSFFQDKPSAEHLYKINFDSERLTHLLTATPPQFILLAGRFLFISALVFYLNWKMALFCLLFAPLLYLQSNYFIARREDILQKQIKISQSIFARLTEVFRHMHLIKALGKEVFEVNNFLKNLSQKMDLLLEDLRLQLFGSSAGNGLRRFVLGAVSVFGGYQIIKGQMSLGSLTAVMIYLSQLIEIQASLSGLFEQTIFDFVSADRIAEILDKKPEIVDSPDAVEINLAGSDIEFENVTFGYKEEKSVLSNLSFSIKYGSMIAIIGPSGCGKTTLLNLILRLYDIKQGKILLGGYDLRDIKLDCLKRNIGEAFQEPFLWNDTVLNNIRYAKQDATFEEIKQAAKLAQIDNFIESLPQGYDTIIGERACKISEGQKQRIAVARAVLKKPTILILDEAMSSLDSNVEEKTMDGIREEFNGSTVIVVSHRLSTVRKMDLIYFLEAPNKMEISRHTELLERNPSYRELFASQIEAERIYPDARKPRV